MGRKGVKEAMEESVCELGSSEKKRGKWAVVDARREERWERWCTKIAPFMVHNEPTLLSTKWVGLVSICHSCTRSYFIGQPDRPRGVDETRRSSEHLFSAANTNILTARVCFVSPRLIESVVELPRVFLVSACLLYVINEVWRSNKTSHKS